MPKLYTVKTLAELFEKDEVTIRRWISEGDVFPGAFKVKDGWYVPSADVDRIIKPKAVSCRPRKGFVREW